jgi:hypothetical protein
MRIVRVTLTPAGLYRSAGVIVDEHLSAMVWETTCLPLADVIVCAAAAPPADPAEPLRRHPGCLIAEQPLIGGGRLIATRSGSITCRAQLPTGVLGSVAHAWLVAGGRLGDLARLPISLMTPVDLVAPVPAAAPPASSWSRPLRARRAR